MGSVWRRGGGVRECLPTPLERAGTWPSRAGPYFFEEIGKKNTKGKEVPSLGTPFSGGRNGGRWFRQVGAWPAASKTNASWPAHRLGRAGESSLLSRGKSGNPNGYFLPSPKGYPPTSPARPSRWAGHEALVLEAAGQVPRKKYSLPPHNPTREGGPGRAGQGSLPFQRRGDKTTRVPRPFQQR